MLARLIAVLAIVAGVGAYAWGQTGLFSPNQFFGGPPSGVSQDFGAPRAIVPADLPVATSAALGAVQGDGSTITITAGVEKCTTATTSQIGCVKPDGSTITISAGTISAVGVASCPTGTTCYTCVGSADQTGINTALATGNTVHLLGVICAVSADLTFTTPGQRVYCDGRTITTINASASAGGFTKGVLYFNTGEPGPTLEGCGIAFPNQVDTTSRAALTGYPPAIYALNTPRFRLLHDRIAVAMVGIDMRGNSGGALIDDMESSCLSVCYLIDGSLDTVRIVNSHVWEFGLSANQKTIFYTTNPNCTPQTTSGASGAIGIMSGRMDGMLVSNTTFLIGTEACFQLGQGNRDGVPWLDGTTFGSMDNIGFDTQQGVIFNQPALTWADTATNAQTLSSSNVLHFASTPMFVGGSCVGTGTVPYDITHTTAIQAGNQIVSCTATTATLQSNVASTVSSGDSIAGQAHNQGRVNIGPAYFSGALNGDTAIVMSRGTLTCSPCDFGNGAGGSGAQVQQSGGVLILGPGLIDHGSGDLPFYNGSGGFVTIKGFQINVNANATQTQSLIHVQAAGQEAVIQGNHVNDHGTGTGTFLQVDADGFHNILGNSAPGWTYTLPTCTAAICTANN